MDFTELVEAFETHTGVAGEIDDAELAIWFNEAQLDLALDFGRIKTVELVPDENGLVTPPEDNIRVIDVDGDLRNVGGDFRWNSIGQLIVDTTAPVRVSYRALPDAAHIFTGADPTQTPDLPLALHHLLAIYAASKYWDRESEGDTEELNLANKWLAQYYAARKAFLSKMNVPGSSNVDRWVVIE